MTHSPVAKYFESEVLRVAELAKSGQPVEDSTWELKRQWPEARIRTARQIAAHCNAACGSNAAWIVGIDDAGEVFDTDSSDFAEWWPQICAHFEGNAPKLIRDCRLRVDGSHIVGLLFDTSQFPYVVRHESRDSWPSTLLEIPWREATSVRSATREDLIRLFGSRQHHVEVSVIKMELWISGAGEVVRGPLSGQLGQEWWLNATCFAATDGSAPLILPHHKSNAKVLSDVHDISLADLKCDGYYSHREASKMTSCNVSTTEVSLPSTGGFSLTFRGIGLQSFSVMGTTLKIELSLCPVGQAEPVVSTTTLQPDRRFKTARGRWFYSK